MPNNADASQDDGLKIAVLLCQDLGDHENGLGLEDIKPLLEKWAPGVVVNVVPDLCQELKGFSRARAVQGADRVVLGLCSGDYPEIEIQAQARKAGLDPLGVEVVPLGNLVNGAQSRPVATRRAMVLLSAAVARAQAHRDGGPELAKPYFLPLEQGMSRRSLFTLPPIGYQPVPGFDREECNIDSGCQLCVRACPRGALSSEDGHIALDKARCDSCGVCVTECPREAIALPGWSLPQFEAQISVLLDPAVVGPEPPSLLFTCLRAADQLAELSGHGVSRWLPVNVPCVGMVTPAWILQTLARGAGEVALLMCGDKCPFRQQDSIRGKADFCRQLLARLGQSPERVRVMSVSEPEVLSQPVHTPVRAGDTSPQLVKGTLRLHATQGALEAIRRLAGDVPLEGGTVLAHPSSPFGVPEMRAEDCTGCRACVGACPTGALAWEHSGNSGSLTLTASLCNGCGMCAEICPEAAQQVLSVRKVTDLGALSRGTVALTRQGLAICETCGEAFASHNMLQRISDRVGGDNETLQGALGRFCPSCRMMAILNARPVS